MNFFRNKPEFSTENCLACRKLRGEIPIPGGAIYENEYLFANHALPNGRPMVYPGWLVIDLKRHITSQKEMTTFEGRSLGLAVTHLCKALGKVINAEHIYVISSCDGVPHVHYHIMPRYSNTPKQYRGLLAPKWPAAPQINELEVEELCERIREQLGFILPKGSFGENAISRICA